MKRTYSTEDRSSFGQVQSFRDGGSFSSLDQGVLLEGPVSAKAGVSGTLTIGFESELAVSTSKAGRVDPLNLEHYNDTECERD